MKKLHLILLLLIVPLLAAAQSAESAALYAKGKDLYNAGDYKKAAETFIEVLELDKAEAPENTYNLDIVCDWIGSSFYKAGEKEKVVDYEPYFYELEPVDRPAMAQIFSYSAMSQQARDIDAALMWLERQNEEEIKLLGPDHYLLVDTYFMLALYEYMRGNNAGAISYNEKLKEVIRKTAPLVTTEGWDAGIYLVDGCIAEQNGDYARTFDYAQKGWERVNPWLSAQSFCYKELFALLMRCYVANQDYDSASAMAAKAEKDYRTLDAEAAERAATLVPYIVEYYLNTVRYSAAAELCEYALERVTDEYTRGRLLTSAGAAYLSFGRDSDAVGRLADALDIFTSLRAEPDAASANFYLGTAMDNLRRYDEAMDYFKQALKLFGKDKDNSAISYFSTLCRLAAIETRTRRYDAALGRLAEARKFTASYPNFFNDIHQAFLYREEAFCYMGKNMNDTAVDKMREAVRLYEQSGVGLDYNYVDAAAELFSMLIKDEATRGEAEQIKDRLYKLSEGSTEQAALMRIKVLDKLANSYMTNMYFDEALAVNEELLDFAKAYPDYDTYDAISNRLMLLIFTGRKAEARSELDELYNSTLSEYGRNSKKHLQAALLSCVYIDQTGDLSQMERQTELGHEIIDIAKVMYSADDPSRFQHLIWGAKILSTTEYNYAVDVILETLRQTPNQIKDADIMSVCNAYTTLATIKNNLWELDDALKYAEKALEAIEGGATGFVTPTALLTAGQIYIKLNRLADAEKVILKALDRTMEMNDGGMAQLMQIYNSLGELYSRMGRYSLVEEYRKKSEQLQAERYSDNDAVVMANSVNGLWAKYNAGKKTECLEDINKVDSIISSIKSFINLDRSLPNRLRAQYYFMEGDIESAKLYCELASLTIETYDNCLLSSRIYGAAGDYAISLERANRAAEIADEINGKNSVTVIAPLVYAAEAKVMLSDKAGAIENYRRAYDIGCDYISNNILTLTAAQRADFWNSNFGFYRTTLPYVTANYLRDTEMNGLLYDAMLFSNGLLFNADRSLTDLVKKSSADVREIYGQWMFKKDLLKRLTTQAEAAVDAKEAESYRADINRITNEVADIERQLLDRIGQTAGNDWRLPKTTWQQVRKALPRGAAAIEFVDYEMGDSISALLALILTKDSKLPVLREICKGDRDFITNDLMFADRDFTDKFFKTFADDIAGCTEVYFVPQGALCSVALESLPVSDGILPSKPEFFRLSSTRELVKARRGKGKNRAATIYGGLKYDMDVDSMVADAERYPELRERGFNADNLLAARVSRKGDVVIPELKGALVEVESVSDFYKKVTGHAPLLKTGAEGTESSIKALSGRYGNIFHISTHGFFAADDSQADNLALAHSETLTAEDIALERSGLLMAGAANRYLGLEDIPSDIDDGILTAAEIAHLDLEKVDLAVLSACETGLGQVTGAGVFGLPRGVQKAGVSSILMSLWKVDDDATCRLITEFYRHWLGDSAAGIAPADKHTALERAKQIVRETPGWENPRYWAAFILLDAID